MSAHRYQSAFNGITFNRHLSTVDETLLPDNEARIDAAFKESDYRLESLDLTRVTVEDFRELRQFLEGAEANESYEGVLIATLRGVIHASSPADLEDKTMAMRAAFSPALVRIAGQATDPLHVLPYTFKLDSAGGAVARILYARPAIGRPIIIGRMREGLSRRYLAQLISFDPRLYAGGAETQQVCNLAGQAITNAGNFYTGPKIRITFSGAGNAALTITNTTTGQALVINATTAAAGEVWIADVKLGTLYRLSDLANRYSQRVSGYVSQLYLMPGANAFTFGNTGGVSEVRADYRSAWA